MLLVSRIVRVGLIIGIALLSLWLLLLWPFYRAHLHDDRPPEPMAMRDAALLAEQIGRADLDRFVRALSLGRVTVRLETRALDVASMPGTPLSDAALQPYILALDGRPVAASALPAVGRIQANLRYLATAPHGWRFDVALRTGDVLTIEAQPSLLVNSFGLPVGFVAGLCGTLMALAALLLIHRETRSLQTLMQAVERIDLSGQPLLLSTSLSRAPEVQTLIRSFNRLQTRLGLLMRSRMAIVGGISHDVRTFATRLRLRMDLIPDGPDRDKAISDISDMITLLDDSLLASRAGAGELAEELIEPADILREDIEDRLARGAPVQLMIAPEAVGTMTLGDRVALRRVIANLVDNAEKYAPHVWVHLTREGPWLHLYVDDDGPGIPPGRREELLEPFVRLEGSRNRDTGGAGLGLAIVRNLVEAQGGTVTIEDAPTSGTRLSVTLPVFEP